MKYTCIIKDGKYFVMEWVGKEPSEFDFETRDDLGKTLGFAEEEFEVRLSRYKLSLSNALPTLPEHSPYWQSMEGKVFGEDVFEQHMYNVGQKSPHGTILGPDNELYMRDIVNYAISKEPVEADLWDEAETGAYSYAMKKKEENASENSAIEKGNYMYWYIQYLKQHYNITRKP